MKTPRWLLPFTHGMDMQAIDHAVRLADSAGAMLVPVSLISAQPTGARLETIQQSKDFLEAAKYKAARFQVPVERYEVFTTRGGAPLDPDGTAPLGITEYVGRKEA